MTRVRHAGVRVPATTANLGPGFDAFGAALSLHLWARTVPREGPRVATVAAGVPDATGPGASPAPQEGELRELPTGDDNLVWQALVRLCDAVDAPVPDVAVRVRTAIPLERGLGSSSAAIVAGLALGRALTGAPLTTTRLVGLATRMEGHPDNVAPAALGGLVVAADGGGRDGPGSDRGGPEEPVVRRAAPAARLRPVVMVPDDRQSTAQARTLLPATVSRTDAAAQAGRAGHVLGALLGAWPVAPSLAGDLLHEPPRLEAMSATGDLLRRLREAGVHAWLSGAGPTVAAAVGRASMGGDGLDACRRAGGGSVGITPLEWDLAGTVVCPEGGCAWAAGPGCQGCPRDTVRKEVW